MTPVRVPAENAAAFDDAEVLSLGSPESTRAGLRGLAAARYGFDGEIVPLTGERDRNYRLQSAEDGTRYMLKLSHPAESALVADFQTQALLHIARVDPGLPVQRIVPTRDGLPSFIADPHDGPRASCACSATCPGCRCPRRRVPGRSA